MTILSRTGLLIVGVALFVAYILSPKIVVWRRLRHIPGPRLAAWTDLWLIWSLWSGKSFDDMNNLISQYGPLVRIGPNHVICGDPDEVRRVWSVRSPFERAGWFEPREWFKSGRGGQAPDDESPHVLEKKYGHHGSLRSKVYAGYQGRGVEGVDDAIDEGIEQLKVLLDAKYLSTPEETRLVDMGRKIQYTTIDIIGKIAFGEPLYYLDNDRDLYDYIDMSHAVNPIIPVAALLPTLLKVMQSNFVRRFLPASDETFAFRPLRKFLQETANKRYGKDAVDKPDMLGCFVRNGLALKDAEAEAMIQVGAGSETTATVIRTTLLHVVANPPIYKRLQQEIDEADARGELSPIPTEAQLQTLPLLQACLREALRIWPPASGLGPRVANIDARICGFTIPAFTSVAWSSKAVMQHKPTYGPDAEHFNPDRWLRASPERFAYMDNALDLGFGAGKGQCLGKVISGVEMGKTVCELVRRYEFGVGDVVRGVKNEFHVVTMQEGLFMRVERRAGRAVRAGENGGMEGGRLD